MSNKVFYCQAYENTLKILNLNVRRCQKLKHIGIYIMKLAKTCVIIKLLFILVPQLFFHEVKNSLQNYENALFCCK